MRYRWLRTFLPLVLIAVACGGGQSDPAPQAQTEEPTTTAGTPTTTATETQGVHVAGSELGEVLVGPDGLTLYVFTADTPGTSTCYDGCAELWPPVPADVGISSDLDQSMFGTTTRDDGIEQLTVNDKPLYWYTPDTAPGDTGGQGLNDVWFVVDPSGEMIGAAAQDSDDENPIIDYDY